MITAMRKLVSNSFGRACSFCLLLLGASTVQAIEFGAMSIYSKVGQSFSADIQVGDLSGIETDSVTLRVLPQRDYARLDIAYDPVLNDIRLSLSKIDDDNGIIQVNTTRPFNRESINLLIEFNFPDGSITGTRVIEYSGILDPTFLATPDQQAASLAVRAPLEESARIDQELLSSHMETVQGDTWDNIAAAIKLAYMRKEDITKEQIMMSLRTLNPNLFNADSHAEVAVSSVVQIPNYAQISRLSQQRAAQSVADIDFRYLRGNQIPGRVRNSEALFAARPTLPRRSSSSGSGGGQPSELERIELVTQLADQNLRSEIAGVYEEIDKRRLESSDLKARVALLDKQAADLQQVIKLKSQQLKLLQQRLRQQLEQEERRRNLPQLGSKTFADVISEKVAERPVFWLMLAVGVLLLFSMVLFVIFSMRAYSQNVRKARSDQIILNERLARERSRRRDSSDNVRTGARAAKAARGDKSKADSGDSGSGDRQVARAGVRMGDMVAGVSRRSLIAPPQNEPYKLKIPDILQLSTEPSTTVAEDRRSAAQQMSQSGQSYLAPGNNIIKVNLDLALAYINMRQYEEARSLLNQVLKDGDLEEVQRAQLLLNGMARKETQAA